jgi:hypothetical protein
MTQPADSGQRRLMTTSRKKLIEVSMPLEAINAACALRRARFGTEVVHKV